MYIVTNIKTKKESKLTDEQFQKLTDRGYIQKFKVKKVAKKPKAVKVK